MAEVSFLPEFDGERDAARVLEMLGVDALLMAGLTTNACVETTIREAYLQLVKSTDVSKIDRGDTKSVRLVFEITPGFLDAARKSPPVKPDLSPRKPQPRKTPTPGKGRT